MAEVPAGQVDAVRAFNRFYTKRIGALSEGLLRSPFSLTEMRVLYELAHRAKPTAGELAADLGLDAGYLSRILRAFAAQGLLAREASAEDGRRRDLTLTEKGRKTFAPFDRASSEEVAAMLAALGTAERRRLVEAMKSIERLLSPRDGRGERSLPRRPARGPLRRARLDRASPRRSLRLGVRLGRKVRRPRRAASPRIFSPPTTRSASAAGSPSSTARSWARSCS